MRRDVTLYVSDIIENMDSAVRFVGGMSFEDFSADQKTSYAVVRCWEIIGEAVKNLPDGVRSKAPDIPWKDMAGMRDRCIHGYVGIDYEVVWTAVKEEIPQVRPKLKSLLDELRSYRL